MFLVLDKHISDFFKNKNAVNAFFSAVVLGLIAHAYSYFNATFLHDRIDYFMYPAFNSAARTKWFAQYIDCLTYFAYLPWLIGVIVIICDALAVFFIVESLEIHSGVAIWIIAGLTVTNCSYIGAHFYWAHEIIAALPFICASVYVWQKNKGSKIKRIISEAILISISMAEYGAYATFGTSLVIIICIFWLLQGSDCKCVFKKGMEYVVAFGTGTILYYVILRIFLKVQNYELMDYAGESRLMTGMTLNELWEYVRVSYVNGIKWGTQQYGKFYAIPKGIVPIFVGVAILVYALYIVRKWEVIRDAYSMILMIVLIGLFPLSVGGIYIMSFGNVHYLMMFAGEAWLMMLVKIIDLDCGDVEKKIIGIIYKIATCIMGVMLIGSVYYGVLVANFCYLRLDQIFNNTKSAAGGLIDKIESCEGFTGNEKIVLIGNPFGTDYYMEKRMDKPWINELTLKLAKDSTATGFTQYGDVPMILREVMGVNLDFEWYDESNFTDEENTLVDMMSKYPAYGSVIKKDDIIFVKGELK